jgi:hypothetical protein
VLCCAYHSNEKTRLLRCSTDTSISNDTNGETSCETCETDGKTSAKLDETLE